MNNKIPKVVVTGSSGRVGSAIVAGLKAAMRTYVIVGVDQVAGQHTSAVFDLRDTAKLAPLVADADAICHCAALHAPHVGVRSDSEFEQINAGVIEALLQFSPPSTHIVLTSSTSIYGHALQPDDRAVWVDEALSPQPRDIYDQTKFDAETMLRSACHGERTGITLRMSRCFPEPERDMALYRLYRGVGLGDVIQAHLLALDVGLDGSHRGYAHYVVSGPTPFVEADAEELYRSPWSCILRYFPMAEKEFVHRSWLPPQSIDRVYVSSLAQKELAYRPKFGFTTLLLD